MKTFSLTEVPIYCLSHKGNDSRKIHIREMEKNQKLNFHIVEGPASTERLPKYESGALTFVHLIMTHLKKIPFEPFVIIENDVSVFSRKYEKFTYPDNADAIFIGISSWSVDLNTNNECGSLNTLKILQSEEFPHLFHDANMLSTHGVFVASRTYALHLAETCLHTVLTKKIVWDVPLARNKLLYHVFALATPIFYQDPVVNGGEFTGVEFTESTITTKELTLLKQNKIN